MAYINKETSKKIREALKAEFGKTVKFSVSISNHSSLNVSIMESPYFKDGEYQQVNHYWIDQHFAHNTKQAAFLNKIKKIIITAGEWWDKSDIMTDYFHTAFYYHINVGKWDKKHVKNSCK